MKILNWWKKLSIKYKGLLLGSLIGFVIFWLTLILPGYFPTTSTFMWRLTGLPFCAVFNVESGEPCAFFYLFYGWIFMALIYGLIGLIVGFIIESIVHRSKRMRWLQNENNKLVEKIRNRLQRADYRYYYWIHSLSFTFSFTELSLWRFRNLKYVWRCSILFSF